jgi:sugar/nucleoside kinase (ribokinase family)
MKTFDVASVCNALMDILVEVSDQDLKNLGLTKGVMHLVDSKRQQEVFTYVNGKAKVTELGGSSMNAIRTLASLGHKTVFAGLVNDDEYGNLIRTRMNSLGIKSILGGHQSESTGTCLILITPDGERTMNTNLGASRLYNSSHIPHEDISKSRIFHFSGYQWDTPEQKHAVMEALKTSKKMDTIVSFDLADPFVVDRNKNDFNEIIVNNADIVFANREEAKLLYGTTPEKTALRIAESGAIAVIKLGADGAVIGRGSDLIKVPSIPTKVIDTTAAGDMFAAGFLHGYLRDRDLKSCGHIAATLASDVISRIGANLSDSAITSARRL